MTTKATRPTSAQRSIAARETRVRKIMRACAIAFGSPVALVAGYASYFHIVSLAVLNGQSSTLAHLTPVSIDGLAIVATIAHFADRKAFVPKASLATGAVLTLAGNAISVHPVHSLIIAYAVAATSAVALLLVSEMLFHLFMPQRPAQRSRTPRKTAQPARKRTAEPKTKRSTQTSVAPVAAPVAA